MRFIPRVGASATVAAVVLAGAALAAQDWGILDTAIGFQGKDLPGGVHRYGWPRSDLRVSIDGIQLEPALALGSWAAFAGAGSGDQVMAMGDLVLLDAEVDPVVGALQEGGLEVTAIHNHLLRETPHVTYVHFLAHGDSQAIARTLRAALGKTNTPTPSASAPKAEPTGPEQAAYAAVQDTLGRTGSMAGRVLQVAVPRAERILDGGMEVPATMGMSTALSFQVVGERVATTGDFVLVAAEVNPVIHELRARGFAVTAVHSHMLTETPRLFFLHFWGLDSPRKVGEALKAALARVDVKPST